jgi:hypothetical protein
MRRIVLATIAILACNFAVSHVAAQEQARPCPFGSGFGSQYLVPNASAAKAIYRAVVSAVAPGNLKKFPIIVVEDKGDHWEVGQEDGLPPPKPEPNEVIVSAGGGQFYMSIDKCTGAITHAALAR